jgi:hypothetical protein
MIFVYDPDRVARFVLGQRTKTIKNIPKNHTLMPQNITNGRKIHITNGHKIYQHLPLHGTPKFSQIGIFGLKNSHLATLDPGPVVTCGLYLKLLPATVSLT